jgi:hypothetical protein
MIAFSILVSAGFSQEGQTTSCWWIGDVATRAQVRSQFAKNHLTLTFGGGAPNFDAVTREEFDQAMAKATAFNKVSRQRLHRSALLVDFGERQIRINQDPPQKSRSTC